jgi:hypothetical protein
VKSFEEQIKDLRETSQSISLLSEESNKFFTEKYSPSGKGGVEKFSSFLSGKIYFAEYLTPSKISDRIQFINRYPLFLFLSEEKTGNETIVKVIDLNIVPPESRGQIIKKIYDFYSETINANQSQIPVNQKSLELNGKSLSLLLEGTGYSFAVTGFKKQYLRNVKVVDYQDWVKLPYLNVSNIQGLPVNSIYTIYRSKLKF